MFETVAGMLLCAIVSIPHGSDAPLQSARSWPSGLLPERDDEAATPRKPESTALARLCSSCGPVSRADEILAQDSNPVALVLLVGNSFLEAFRM